MKKIQKYFSNNANIYDQEIHNKSLGTQYLSLIETNFVKKCLLHNRKNNNLRSLEIGAGTGRFTEILIQNGFSVDIIENADGMINLLKKKFSKEKVLIIKSDASYSFPIQSNSYSVVIAIRLLKYIPTWKNTIKEVKRVLNKNGYFIFSISNIYSLAYFKGNAHYFLFKPKEVIDYIERIGMKVIKISPTSRLPFPLYIRIHNKFMLKILVYIEQILNIIFPYWLFSRSILIFAQVK